MSKIFDKNLELFSSHKEENDYKAYKLTKTQDTIDIRYFVDNWSSSWITDRNTFKKFPKKFAVMSGGWYQDKGRWRTLKRIVREIKCVNISELSEKNTSGKEGIIFNKEFSESKIDVKIKSKEIGLVRFKCDEISFTDYYKLLAFDNELDKFIDATNLFEEGMTFIGKL